jgi:hypothetical protein
VAFPAYLIFGLAIAGWFKTQLKPETIHWLAYIGMGGKMNTATGLTRLGTVFKAIGYVCFAVAAIGAVNGFNGNHPGGDIVAVLLFGVPGAGLWLVECVIQGIAKPS